MSRSMLSVEALTAADVSRSGRALGYALMVLGLWVLVLVRTAPQWENNPVYAYGWFVPVLSLFFLWTRLSEFLTSKETSAADPPVVSPMWLQLALWGTALGMFPFEWLRGDFAFNRMDCLLSVLWAGAVTWLVCGASGGRRLQHVVFFPCLLFLSAVPWPYRWESALTIELMRWVTSGVALLLNLLDHPVVPEGTVLTTLNGPVGVAEACSGIQSLQASLMFGLAVGEFYRLRLSLRVGLVGVAAALALIFNLLRTLILSLLVEQGGATALEKHHDLIGSAALVLLPIPLLAVGYGLARGSRQRPAPAAFVSPARGVSYWQALPWGRLPAVWPALMLGTIGVCAALSRPMLLDRLDPPEPRPLFSLQERTDLQVETSEMPPEVLKKLNPTKSTLVRLRYNQFPDGTATAYHLFWEPNPGNRFVTSHRPDVCVPASGWEHRGEVQALEVTVGGCRVRVHLFTFAREHHRALQLWGIWANGHPVPMNFSRGLLGLELHPDWTLIPGRHRPSVEVLSCFLFYEGDTPPVQQAAHALEQLFRCRPASPSAPATP